MAPTALGFPAPLPCRIQDKPSKWASDYVPPGHRAVPVSPRWLDSLAYGTEPKYSDCGCKYHKAFAFSASQFLVSSSYSLTYRHNQLMVDDFCGSLLSQCPSISGILVGVRAALEGDAVTVQETCDPPCDLL